LEQAPSIHRGGGHEVGRFKEEGRLVIGRHSTFLSMEEHRVAAGVLFYKVGRRETLHHEKGDTK
jgi:hypothetical protein